MLPTTVSFSAFINKLLESQDGDAFVENLIRDRHELDSSVRIFNLFGNNSADEENTSVCGRVLELQSYSETSGSLKSIKPIRTTIPIPLLHESNKVQFKFVSGFEYAEIEAILHPSSMYSSSVFPKASKTTQNHLATFFAEHVSTSTDLSPIIARVLAVGMQISATGSVPEPMLEKDTACCTLSTADDYEKLLTELETETMPEAAQLFLEPEREGGNITISSGLAHLLVSVCRPHCGYPNPSKDQTMTVVQSAFEDDVHVWWVSRWKVLSVTDVDPMTWSKATWEKNINALIAWLVAYNDDPMALIRAVHILGMTQHFFPGELTCMGVDPLLFLSEKLQTMVAAVSSGLIAHEVALRASTTRAANLETTELPQTLVDHTLLTANDIKRIAECTLADVAVPAEDAVAAARIEVSDPTCGLPRNVLSLLKTLDDESLSGPNLRQGMGFYGFLSFVQAIISHRTIDRLASWRTANNERISAWVPQPVDLAKDKLLCFANTVPAWGMGSRVVLRIGSGIDDVRHMLQFDGGSRRSDKPISSRRFILRHISLSKWERIVYLRACLMRARADAVMTRTRQTLKRSTIPTEEELPCGIVDAIMEEGGDTTTFYPWHEVAEDLYAAVRDETKSTLPDARLEKWIGRSFFPSYPCQVPDALQVVFPLAIQQSFRGTKRLPDHAESDRGAIITEVGRDVANTSFLKRLCVSMDMSVYGVLDVLETGAYLCGYKPVYNYVHLCGFSENSRFRKSVLRYEFEHRRPHWPDAYLPDCPTYLVSGAVTSDHMFEWDAISLKGFKRLEQAGPSGEFASDLSNKCMSEDGLVTQEYCRRAENVPIGLYSPRSALPTRLPVLLSPARIGQMLSSVAGNGMCAISRDIDTDLDAKDAKVNSHTIPITVAAMRAAISDLNAMRRLDDTIVSRST